MNQPLPEVPDECRPFKIPIFHCNLSLLAYGQRYASPKPPTSISSDYLPSRHYFPSTMATFPECQCPHIMIADDDPFEGLYYLALFKQSVSSKRYDASKENLRLMTLRSGEELIDHYKKTQICGCGSLTLIITDYNMGKTKLNGVEATLKLRSAGYAGPIIMRTSDTTEELSKTHHILEALLSTKVITTILNKSDHAKIKEIIKALLEIKTKELGISSTNI